MIFTGTPLKLETFQSMSIFAIHRSRRQETVSLPKYPREVLQISSDGMIECHGGKNHNPPPPQKKTRASNKSQKKSLDQILTPKKSHAEFPRPSLVVLYLENYMATSLQIVLNTPKNPYLNQSTNKNTHHFFLPKKNPGIENFKPKKILWSSPSLEIQSPLRGLNIAWNNKPVPYFLELNWCKETFNFHAKLAWK